MPAPTDSPGAAPEVTGDERAMTMLRRCAVAGACVWLAVSFAAAALAEPPEVPKDAMPEVKNPETTSEAADLSTLALAVTAPAGPLDTSKFTAGVSAVRGWDAKAGVDTQGQASSVAWANVTAPGLPAPWSWDKTTVETRIDPEHEGRLGMTLSRSVPLGGNFELTLQNGYSVTQTFIHGATPQLYETNQALRFNFLPSDTMLSVGRAMSSTDDRWLPSLTAEQKLFGGPLSVTGSVSESAGGDVSKSLKAGFKRTW